MEASDFMVADGADIACVPGQTSAICAGTLLNVTTQAAVAWTEPYQPEKSLT